MHHIFVKIDNKTIHLDFEDSYEISVKELCYCAFNIYFKKFYPKTVNIEDNPFKLSKVNNFLKMGYLHLGGHEYVRFKDMDKKINLSDYIDKTLTFNFTFPAVNELFTREDIDEIVKIDFTKFS